MIFVNKSRMMGRLVFAVCALMGCFLHNASAGMLVIKGNDNVVGLDGIPHLPGRAPGHDGVPLDHGPVWKDYQADNVDGVDNRIASDRDFGNSLKRRIRAKFGLSQDGDDRHHVSIVRLGSDLGQSQSSGIVGLDQSQSSNQPRSVSFLETGENVGQTQNGDGHQSQSNIISEQKHSEKHESSSSFLEKEEQSSDVHKSDSGSNAVQNQSSGTTGSFDNITVANPQSTTSFLEKDEHDGQSQSSGTTGTSDDIVAVKPQSSTSFMEKDEHTEQSQSSGTTRSSDDIAASKPQSTSSFLEKDEHAGQSQSTNGDTIHFTIKPIQSTDAGQVHFSDSFLQNVDKFNAAIKSGTDQSSGIGDVSNIQATGDLGDGKIHFSGSFFQNGEHFGQTQTTSKSGQVQSNGISASGDLGSAKITVPVVRIEGGSDSVDKSRQSSHQESSDSNDSAIRKITSNADEPTASIVSGASKPTSFLSVDGPPAQDPLVTNVAVKNLLQGDGKSDLVQAHLNRNALDRGADPIPTLVIKGNLHGIYGTSANLNENRHLNINSHLSASAASAAASSTAVRSSSTLGTLLRRGLFGGLTKKLGSGSIPAIAIPINVGIVNQIGSGNAAAVSSATAVDSTGSSTAAAAAASASSAAADGASPASASSSSSSSSSSGAGSASASSAAAASTSDDFVGLLGL